MDDQDSDALYVTSRLAQHGSQRWRAMWSLRVIRDRSWGMLQRRFRRAHVHSVLRSRVASAARELLFS